MLISILGGAIVPLQLAIVNAFRESTQASQIQSTFYLYLGGALASLVFIAAPKIGAGNTLLWVFLGQMYFAMILNQTGWFGLEVKTIDIYKISGLALVTLGGAILIYGETKAK